MGLARVVGVVIGVPVVIVMGKMADEKRIDEYNLTSSDVVVYDRCERAMTSNELKFNGGASKGDGCACIAKHAIADFPQEQTPAFSEFMSLKLKTAKSNLNNKEMDLKEVMAVLEKLQKVQEKHGLSDNQFSTMVTKSTEYIDFCGTRKNHSKESVSRIAQLTPKSANKAKASTQTLLRQ